VTDEVSIRDMMMTVHLPLLLSSVMMYFDTVCVDFISALCI